MDYEIKYKDALERARKYKEKKYMMINAVLDNIFPELEDSKDYIIRKALIDYFDDVNKADENPLQSYGIHTDKVIAWLEKQGEKKHKFIIGDIISNNNVIYRVDNIVKNCIGQNCYFLVNVESEKDGTRYIKLTDSKGKTHNSGEITWLCEQVDAKFEKQSKQEEPQVYEPKFHIGEWVVRGKTIAQILDIQEQYYVGLDINGNDFVSSRFLSDDKIHLWTIADAKVGDVLFHSDSASNGIFIFKEILQCGTIQKVICYCDYDSEDGFCLGEKHTCCWADDKILHPATKEQREILFQKMKEAGYKWNSETKELIKVSTGVLKETWSKEDERICQCLIKDQNEALKEVRNDKYGHSEVISDLKDMYRERIEWLKQLKRKIGG